MILDTNLTVTRSTTGQNDEGMVTRTFTTLGIIRANVQPKALTAADLQNYGISDINAEAKIVFSKFGWQIGDRFTHGGLVHEVRGISRWGNHIEAVAMVVKS
jgi:hypothetical protein